MDTPTTWTGLAWLLGSALAVGIGWGFGCAVGARLARVLGK